MGSGDNLQDTEQQEAKLEQQIENLKEGFDTLDNLEDKLYTLKASCNEADLVRLKTHIENGLILNDAGTEKWVTERLFVILSSLLSMFGGAMIAKLQSVKELVMYTVIVIGIFAIMSIAFGHFWERKIRKLASDKAFYEICLNVLFQN